MAWGARTSSIGASALRIALIGVLLYLQVQVQCHQSDAFTVHNSSELASALRNASIASQTAPTSTLIHLASNYQVCHLSEASTAG